VRANGDRGARMKGAGRDVRGRNYDGPVALVVRSMVGRGSHRRPPVKSVREMASTRAGGCESGGRRLSAMKLEEEWQVFKR
jgi:hypothetical protein